MWSSFSLVWDKSYQLSQPFVYSNYTELRCQAGNEDMAVGDSRKKKKKTELYQFCHHQAAGFIKQLVNITDSTSDILLWKLHFPSTKITAAAAESQQFVFRKTFDGNELTRSKKTRVKSLLCLWIVKIWYRFTLTFHQCLTAGPQG